MTDERTRRGEAIAQRRRTMGIFTVSEFARRSGKARDTIAAAEAGKAAVATYDELESWLDGHAADDAEHGPVEFDVTGPTTRWHVVVRGPVSEADELRRQVVELLKEIDTDE